MPVNTDYELAYEDISMVVQEFEHQALRTGRREGILAVLNGPLNKSDQILRTSGSALQGLAMVRPTTGNSTPNANLNPGVVDAEDESTDQPGGSVNAFFQEGIEAGLGLEYDTDLADLFGGSDNWFNNYLEECLNCSLRVKFDAQVKPAFLLRPINLMLDEINDLLGLIEVRLDPFQTLQDICWALDELKTWCIPDIIMVLMSLKMLLRRYMTNVINITLDWTTLLGPILKSIVEGISVMLDSLLQIIMAPLECSIASLGAANQLYREAVALIDTFEDFGSFTSNIAKDIKNGAKDFNLSEAAKNSAQFIMGKDVRWDRQQPEAGNFNNYSEAFSDTLPPETGRLDVNTRLMDQEQRPGTTTFFTGININENLTLPEALKDPDFENFTIFEKMILPVVDFTNWVRELVNKLINSFESLGELVGQGLSINLDNLGVMLFITDMISLIMIIIKLLKTNPDERDWCNQLQENPELLENQLRGRYGDIRIEPLNEESLVLFRGPEQVGTITTCHDARSPRDQQLISQWVEELNNRGSNGS